MILMKIKITAFNIKYKDNNRIWTIRNIQNYAEHNIVDSYDYISAPHSLSLEVDSEDIDNYEKIKQQIEDITGLEVDKCIYSYFLDDDEWLKLN